MGELLNPKRERFARLLVDKVMVRDTPDSMTKIEAFVAAGYSKSHKEAKKVSKLPDVMARVAELQRYNSELLEVKPFEVLAELRYLAFNNMADYVDVDEEGRVKMKSMTDLTREQTAAIQELVTEVVTTTRGHGADAETEVTHRTKLKLYSKREALVDLGRTVGMFVKKHEHEHRGITIHMTPQDLAV